MTEWDHCMLKRTVHRSCQLSADSIATGPPNFVAFKLAQQCVVSFMEWVFMAVLHS
ncbi:unnamed protein product, partial [Staurois parvus]